jgi:hypothetical protein
MSNLHDIGFFIFSCAFSLAVLAAVALLIYSWLKK